MSGADFNVKKIYDNLIKRAKQAKEWYITCYVEEEWIPNGLQLPFEVIIHNGIFICRVISPTYLEAQTVVANTLPVIKFIEDPEDDPR